MTAMLARRQLRLVALTALQSLQGVFVVSPGDWESAPARLPEVKLRCPVESKTSLAKTAPEFTTTSTLEILATVQATTAEAAQDAIEDLGQRIEVVVLGCVSLVKLLQQVASVNTQTHVTSDGDLHTARMLMSLALETCEVYDPIELDPSLAVALSMLDVHMDTIRPFSPGAFTGAPFPASVVAEPRASGPDGRDEAHVQITLPT